jgi:hypothetical protein
MRGDVAPEFCRGGGDSGLAPGKASEPVAITSRQNKLTVFAFEKGVR